MKISFSERVFVSTNSLNSISWIRCLWRSRSPIN